MPVNQATVVSVAQLLGQTNAGQRVIVPLPTETAVVEVLKFQDARVVCA